MGENSTLYTIIFIITLSTLFPMVGFYLDYRHKRKQFNRDKKK